MRTIKFRGQRTDTSEIVYGYYAVVTAEDLDLHEVPLAAARLCHIIMGPNTYYHVKAETVGQLTGQVDMDGVDIYEGDTAVWYVNDVEREGEIYYDGQSFDLMSPEMGCVGWDALRGEIKVISSRAGSDS